VGNYIVKLITTTNLNCIDSLTKQVHSNPSPISSFMTIDTSECLKVNNFAFTNSTTISSGSFTSVWRFGDKATSTLTNPTHTYPATGTYLVKLFTTSNNGCKDSSLVKYLYVRTNTSVAFTVSDTFQCLRGNSFTFTDKSSIPTGTYTLSWKFGDNTTATISPAIKSYNTVSLFKAWLVTLSDYGCKDSTSKNIHIYPHPITTFSINDTAQCYPGNSFKFTNNTSITAGSYTSLWKFGDGFTSTLKSTTHSYKNL